MLLLLLLIALLGQTRITLYPASAKLQHSLWNILTSLGSCAVVKCTTFIFLPLSGWRFGPARAIHTYHDIPNHPLFCYVRDVRQKADPQQHDYHTTTTMGRLHTKLSLTTAMPALIRLYKRWSYALYALLRKLVFAAGFAICESLYIASHYQAHITTITWLCDPCRSLPSQWSNPISCLVS